jgi:hypothetical protein
MRTLAAIGASIFLITVSAPAKAQSTGSANEGNNGPKSTVYEVVNGLLSQRIKDSDETQYFAPAFALACNNYITKYGRYFDAEVLLGVQDWSSMSIKSIRDVYLSNSKALVYTVLYDTYDETHGNPKVPDMIMKYTLIRVEGLGWKIDDIMYNDRSSMREEIAHAAWCESTVKQSGNPIKGCEMIDK